MSSCYTIYFCFLFQSSQGLWGSPQSLKFSFSSQLTPPQLFPWVWVISVFRYEILPVVLPPWPSPSNDSFFHLDSVTKLYVHTLDPLYTHHILSFQITFSNPRLSNIIQRTPSHQTYNPPILPPLTRHAFASLYARLSQVLQAFSFKHSQFYMINYFEHHLS